MIPRRPGPFRRPALCVKSVAAVVALRDIERAVCQLLRSTPRWRPVTQAPAPGWSVMPSKERPKDLHPRNKLWRSTLMCELLTHLPIVGTCGVIALLAGPLARLPINFGAWLLEWLCRPTRAGDPSLTLNACCRTSSG